MRLRPLLCISSLVLPIALASPPLSPRQASVGSSPGARTSSLVSSASKTASTASTPPNATTIVDPTVKTPGWIFPQPFDTVLSTNFTSLSCPSFFKQFLASKEFSECHPFSFLISTSNGFFKAQKDPETLPFVLKETCYAPPHCFATMASLVTKIQQDSVCGQDLTAENALAGMALQGFENYDMSREAGCTKDDVTGAYCFAEAAASKEPDASYVYNLALGTSLPSGTKTDCQGSCTKLLMNIYSRYATNPALEISKTYSAAQTLVNRECGPEFARIATKESGAGQLSGLGKWLSILMLCASIWVIGSASLG